MKIIVVEDDQNKLKQIRDFIKKHKPLAEIVVRKSYQSGLNEIVNSYADLILLDMSMPTYDQSPTESGGRQRPFAGREILRKMNRHKIGFPVLILTQFTRFGDEKKAISLEELTRELGTLEYKNYLGTIYYSAEAANWEEKLLVHLNDIDS